MDGNSDFPADFQHVDVTVSVLCDNHTTLADPMVGYWCRVGSQALTHTRNDVATLVQRRTLLSILL